MNQPIKAADLKWYAQSPTKIYSATGIQDILTATIDRPTDEEFKSDEFLSAKKLGPEGISRYGVSHNASGAKPLLDFYIQNVDHYDFHYRIGMMTYRYKVRFIFSYTDKNNKQQTVQIENFARFMNMTKKERSKYNITFTDVFVYKFGHSDITLGKDTSTELTHDGNAIGFQVSLKFDENKTANIHVKAKLNMLNNTSPEFEISITPSFVCDCTVELISTDDNYKETKYKSKLKAKNKNPLLITPNMPNTMTIMQESKENEEQRVRSEYRSIARFVDWKNLPLNMHIDWDKDSIEEIGEKFLIIANYITNKPNYFLESGFFQICDINNQTVVTYTNKKKYGILIFNISVDDNNLYRVHEEKPYYLISEVDNNILSIIDLIRFNDKTKLEIKINIIGSEEDLPKLKIQVKAKNHIKGSFEIKGTLPIKCLGKTFNYDLNDETMIIETK